MHKFQVETEQLDPLLTELLSFMKAERMSRKRRAQRQEFLQKSQEITRNRTHKEDEGKENHGPGEWCQEFLRSITKKMTRTESELADNCSVGGHSNRDE